MSMTIIFSRVGINNEDLSFIKAQGPLITCSLKVT